MKPYQALSSVYEYLICDCDYEKWSQYLLAKLNEYVGTLGVGLDLACGSGFFTRKIKKAGYKICGIDLSVEMLAQAKQNAQKEKLNISFLNMDIANLKVIEKVDFITIINDGINYIPQNKLAKTFKNISKALNKGGYLFFDISSEYKLKNILGNNLFGEDRDNCTYLWFNHLFEDYVDFDITLFVKDGESYQRFDENHREYIHTLSQIKDQLENNGFELVECVSHLGEKITPQSQRLQFIARKI